MIYRVLRNFYLQVLSWSAVLILNAAEEQPARSTIIQQPAQAVRGSNAAPSGALGAHPSSSTFAWNIQFQIRGITQDDFGSIAELALQNQSPLLVSSASGKMLFYDKAGKLLAAVPVEAENLPSQDLVSMRLPIKFVDGLRIASWKLRLESIRTLNNEGDPVKHPGFTVSERPPVAPVFSRSRSPAGAQAAPGELPVVKSDQEPQNISLRNEDWRVVNGTREHIWTDPGWVYFTGKIGPGSSNTQMVMEGFILPGKEFVNFTLKNFTSSFQLGQQITARAKLLTPLTSPKLMLDYGTISTPPPKLSAQELERLEQAKKAGVTKGQQDLQNLQEWARNEMKKQGQTPPPSQGKSPRK